MSISGAKRAHMLPGLTYTVFKQPITVKTYGAAGAVRHARRLISSCPVASDGCGPVFMGGAVQAGLEGHDPESLQLMFISLDDEIVVLQRS